MLHARHRREAERLASLRSYRVIDTAPDPALNALASAAALALGAQAAVIGLVEQDRQWFAAQHGLDDFLGYHIRQTSLEVSFCAYIVATEQVLVVPDTRADTRFCDNVLVTGPEDLRAYAGAPIIGRDGLTLGALCVLDHRTRHHDESALTVLRDLAGAAAELLELRRLDAAAGLSSRALGFPDPLTESHRLRAGIDADELVVHYQPVVDLPSGRWVGLEALVRWDHPHRGLLPPSAFLPLAEASGLILPLGRDVLRQACQQVARWRREIPAAADLHVAVNVSGRQLSEGRFPEVVAEALTISGLPPDALVLELTETSLAGSSADIDIALQRIRATGVPLALDDFGTGYASFNYLQRFHPDIVKIDRCFVDALGRSTRDDLLTRSLVSLGQQLGCDVVAEGVENRQQARTLTTWGVRNAQGHLFCTPSSAAHLQEQLRTAPAPRN